MHKRKCIQVYEYERLIEGQEYGPENILFSRAHLDVMARYLTENQGCPYYTLYYDRVKFGQFVGVIQVADLTIEVLPKSDRHNVTDKGKWQNVLIKMLFLSLQVNARITSMSFVNIKQLTALEAYLMLFLQEAEMLMRQGLVKKYRTHTGNQTSLKGRLLLQEHVTKNMVHAERFYVAHQTYDRNNIYNCILKKALDCINGLIVSAPVKSKCNSLLLDFPECNVVTVTEKLFSGLRFDRKTDRYRTAIELARIILLNYHPDMQGGGNNILAIMVDMNQLWENYVYNVLKRASLEQEVSCSVYAQQKAPFWEHPSGRTLKLKPDIIFEYTDNIGVKKVVLDTKWKYESDPRVEDVRQMYAYHHYFISDENYLIYPDKSDNEEPVWKSVGNFYDPQTWHTDREKGCGLMYVDLLDAESKLNMNIGAEIIQKLIVR